MAPRLVSSGGSCCASPRRPSDASVLELQLFKKLSRNLSGNKGPWFFVGICITSIICDFTEVNSNAATKARRHFNDFWSSVKIDQTEQTFLKLRHIKYQSVTRATEQNLPAVDGSPQILLVKVSNVRIKSDLNNCNSCFGGNSCFHETFSLSIQ